MKIITCCVATLFSFTIISAQSFLKAAGKNIVNEEGENVLLRGVGLGGWMLQEGYMLGLESDGQQYKIRERVSSLLGKKKTAEFYEAWLNNHTTKADVDSLKSWGFNSVRLPMHYNLYTLPAEDEPVKGKNTWLAKGFALTDSLLSWCKANSMYLILDLHAAPGGQGNDLNISDRNPDKPSLWQSLANQQKTIALWKQLASRYASEPAIAAFDILNEPNWGFADTANDKHGLKEQVNAPLIKLYMDITKAIREVDKKHIIIIEGNGWGNNYNGLMATWDDNMVLSFHKYWNYNDTASIAKILQCRSKYNVPVWLGETGENSNVWLTDAIRLLETYNIGWAVWPLKKIGINNPMQIKVNLNYSHVLDYWNGKTKEPPKETNAYSGLLELATYTNIANNKQHRDVIDAVIRQPFNKATLPFKQNIIDTNTTLQAIDYDLGRNGVAYYDIDSADYHISTGKNTAGNRGRTYRNDGVDIYKDSATYEGYYIGHIEAGEWLCYTVQVSNGGNYTLRLLASNGSKIEGKITITDSGQAFAKEVTVPVTTSNGTWEPLEVENVHLTTGMHKLKLFFDKGGFNLKQIQFNKD